MTKGIIISLGSVNADFQVRVDQEPGSTTTMLAHDFKRLSGGKAANVAYLAQRLGSSALLLAHVGKDDLGEQALHPLKDIGIDLRYVRKIEDVATGMSMITVPPSGKKKIILAPNANDNWEVEDQDVVREVIQQAPDGSVLVVDYEVPPFIVKCAIDTAYKKKFTVMLDPSPANRVDKELFAKIDFISPDASETEELTGIKPDAVEHAINAAKVLIDEGVKAAIIRLEEGGCVAMNRETMLHVPPVPIEVVDTTGAGDGFAGAFAVAILEQQSLRDAVCFASAVSLKSITAYGSQPAYPSREEIASLYQEVNAKTRTIDV